MNDLRFPGLRSAVPAVTRAEPVLPSRGLRSGTADAGAAEGERASFDRALQRSTEPDRSAERQLAAREAQRQSERLAERHAQREIAREPARPAERNHERTIDRRAERTVDRSTERAQAQPARDEPTAPMNRSTPDRGSVRPDAERGGTAAADAAPSTATASTESDAGDSAPADTAARSASTDQPGATAALVAASAAISAQVTAAVKDATTEAVADAPDAATDTAAVDGAATALPGGAAARSKAAARTESMAVVDDSGRSSGRGAINELSADLTRTPAKDRLLEDFERRFENSLARAVGASGLTGTSPLNPTSPLAVAGLPQQLAPTLSAPMLATAAVATPLGHPAFGEDLSQRVMLFAGQRVQSAELSVTPADMGPISVSIEVRGQEAAMQFAATHATTRAAIEDALPRLREMLAAQGLQLTQADVGDRAPRDPQGGSFGPGGQGSGNGPWSGNSGGSARGTQAAAEPVVRRLGLIDIRV